MAATALLTICTGLSCSLTESNLNSEAVNSANFVQTLSNELKAANARLYGFQIWLSLKIDSSALELVRSIDESANSKLNDIKRNVDQAKAEGKDVDHCFNEAFADIKNNTQTKFQSMIQCVNNFVTSTSKSLEEIPNRLQEITSLQSEVDSIMPDCETRRDRLSCIDTGTNRLFSSIYNIESFSRITVEHGNGNYYTQNDEAMKCLRPILEENIKDSNRVNWKAVECIRAA